MSWRTVYGNEWSEKGWRMCNRDECDIARIPGLTLVDTAPLRKGPPLTILGAWLFWYDRNVEEIVSPVWGWSNTNDVGNSNHLAGVAVDVNAPKYPWGARVMPAGRIAKVREGLRLFEDSVFWGADWNRADEMHYDLAWKEGDPRNEAFANKLAGGYLGIYGHQPTTTPVDDGVLRLGSEGDAVRELQTGLNRVFPTYSQLDADGIYGPLTAAVVTEFQTRTWVNGIVSDDTRAALAQHGIVPAVWPQSATDRELLEYVAEQVGPGHPAWPSAGMTLRDKIFTL